MNSSGAAILLSTMLLAAAAAFVPSARAGAVERWSDVAFMNASRCAGLAQGAKLDTAAIDARLDAEERGRIGYVADKASQMRDDAAQQSRHASGAARRAIDAELAGPCQAFLKG